MRFLPIILKEHLIDYPTPINFSYFWSFGSLAGIFLAMHYTPHILYAFVSVEHIMRDVNYGWLLRYLHANGASFFFIVVYIHIARGLYYSSYVFPHSNLWRVGIIIFILMMATAFMGYVLPWGQMSFWGATVITNLFTAIPLIGESIAYWLWGGFSVDNATLNRFFSLHYLLPFLIVGLILLHLILLHLPGSSNPLKLSFFSDKISFYPYFYLKDLFSLFSILLFFLFFVFFFPNLLGHSDNYIPANPLSTPSHIVPEWYFLPFYAILRSIPDKLGGVLCMFGALIILLLLPNIVNITKKDQIISLNIVNPEFRPISRLLFWLFVCDVVLLGWLGGKPVEDPYIALGMFATLYYFFHLLILLPFSYKIEHFFLHQKLYNTLKYKKKRQQINFTI
jgi:quinol-cytochrome oxidoreductase complex cytochrome b subunit